MLVDEGHDFEPEWLKLVAQMVHPETNSLLVLYVAMTTAMERLCMTHHARSVFVDRLRAAMH